MRAKPIVIFEILKSLREVTATRESLGLQVAREQWREIYGDDLLKDLEILDLTLEETARLTRELVWAAKGGNS